MTSFYSARQLFLTSESVTEGHPDKLCDQISDGVLDAMLAEDPYSRVACETVATTGMILVCGEVSTRAQIDVARVARSTIRRAGYDSLEYGFHADSCGVLVALGSQSPDIDLGVSHALESRTDAGADEIDRVGAGDQGMMVGFACEETEQLMPLPISLAHGLTRRLAQVRRSGEIPYLRPDGKAQVTIEYGLGQPRRTAAVVVSAQHQPGIEYSQIVHDITDAVIRQVVPAHLMDDQTRIYVNPTGRFVVGGPVGDAGLTGRKTMVDAYGGLVPHGGGAFSGKDPTKVDRSGAYGMRWVAKNIVAAGLARRCELQVCYAIGVARPLAIALETFGTGVVADEALLAAVEEIFDLRPAAIVRDLNLRRPIYQPTAAYGHFGRTDIDAPWEQLNRVDALKAYFASSSERERGRDRVDAEQQATATAVGRALPTE
jgi:S-adenosylmethionine synthetase